MDGHGWFTFDRIGALCAPPLARLLGESIDLERVVADLVGGRQPLAA